MKRKRWSDAKIARTIEDQRRAGNRPRGGGADSIQLWVAVLRDLRDELHLPRVGLFVGCYSGSITTEVFDVSRREVARQIELGDALRSLEEGQVTVIPLQ